MPSANLIIYEYDLNPICHLDDQEPWDRTRGLKLLCRFNLLKADGVLIWNSPELLSPCSTGDSFTLRGLEPSLLDGKMEKRGKHFKHNILHCASKCFPFLCFHAFLSGKDVFFEKKDITLFNQNKLVLD